jgi:hypothetical protein
MESDRRFCDFSFFRESPSGPSLEYPIGAISNFYENSRRYSHLWVHRRCGGKAKPYDREKSLLLYKSFNIVYCISLYLLLFPLLQRTISSRSTVQLFLAQTLCPILRSYAVPQPWLKYKELDQSFIGLLVHSCTQPNTLAFCLFLSNLIPHHALLLHEKGWSTLAPPLLPGI